MAAHYGVAIIPDAHKNAMNVILALWQSENLAESENISQPLNATGGFNDPTTHWVGGRLYNDDDLAIIQDMANNIPSASWPVTGVSGPVSLQDAQDACAALFLMVGTAETYTTPLAVATLNSALGALGLQRVVEE